MSGRIIKFRVWTGSEYEEVELSPSGGYGPLIDWGKSQDETDRGNGIVSIVAPDNHAAFVWEQFTGLTDSKGVDIYEGDIVRWTHGVTDVGVVEYRVHDEFGSYPHAAFFGLLVTRFAGLCQFQSDDTYEVIGNIHQHSHLLQS